jgi:hypothetical protein
MEMIESGSTLPLSVQVPTAIVLAIVLLGALRIVRTISGGFVVFACWLRFMISAFHVYTNEEFVAGLSGSAIGSALLFLLGLVLLPRKLLLSTGIVAAYAVIGAVALSGFVNAAYTEAIDPIVKFGLFAMIALHSYNALKTGDERRFGIGLMLAFAPLLVFQILSLVLGIPKGGASIQGASNFIGGYGHEAAFSVALAALLVVAAINRRIPIALKTSGIALALIGIHFAAYRTAIIAVTPILLYFLLKGIAQFFDARLRPLIVAVAGAALVAAGSTYMLSSERFADLRTIAESDEPLIKDPQHFDETETALLSGRAYLWSSYLYAWKEGNQVQHLVGFGPDSWTRHFQTYAHNTFINFVFEYGVVGLLALILLIVGGYALAIQARCERWKLVCAHLSFLILNLATMPMWMVEGLILYGLLWGHTMYRRTFSDAAEQPAGGRPVLRPVTA